MCGRTPLRDPDGERRKVEVRVLTDGEHRVAHYSGVHLCGAVWLCPVCGPTIRQRRAVDLDTGAAEWIRRHGAGSVMLLTLTIPHDAGETLATVLGTVRAGYGKLMAGRAWQADKAQFGVAHYVRAHDCTIGPNGWHPHIHAVLFARRVLRPLELVALQTRLSHRWADAVESQYRRRPSESHGVQLEQARSLTDVNRYVCQVVVGTPDDYTAPVAYEVARGDLKTGRPGHLTPWEVLDKTREPSTRDVASDTWAEWETATKGVHAIRWSKGLRAELGLDVEASDEAIVAEEVGGELVYQFDDITWARISRAPARVTVGVLEAAERQGAEGIRAYLASGGYLVANCHGPP